MTDKKAKAFSSGLGLTEASKIGMISNNISPLGGRHIIKSLSQQILELNLENNLIGKGDEFVKALVDQLASNNCLLQNLNIAHNEINDD